MRRAKVVATIGPASDSEEVLEKLIHAGLNVARLNFSHGAHVQHQLRIERIRRASLRLKQPVAVLQDLQGPKIRTGEIGDGRPVVLTEGARFILTSRKVKGTESICSTTYEGLSRDVAPGSRLLLADGTLELQVEAVDGPDVVTRVVHGGPLRDHAGINLPGVAPSLPALTPKDYEDLRFGLRQGVDFVAISFVRTAQDVAQARQAIAELDASKANTPVIAKLEKPAAVENLDAILEVADGVMVARGDLGVELSPEKVPSVQKHIILRANQRGRVVITATQMLESMISNPRPTRAEASDVANAIFDGSDALMLSGETAAGQFPVQSVETMVKIIEEAEENIEAYGRWRGAELGDADDEAVALTQSASRLAGDRDVAAVAIFTRSGRTARLMSKSRPRVPILAFTPVPETLHQMQLLWGVTPFLVPHADTVEAMLAHVEATMLLSSPIKPGQQIILIAGFPVHVQGPANFIMLHTVGGR